MSKFVFVTGGVVSSIGKGIVAASLESIERSLSVVSEDIELKKILSQADLDHDYWSSQPLSVEQFKEPAETENPGLKKPLKVSQPPSET